MKLPEKGAEIEPDVSRQAVPWQFAPKGSRPFKHHSVQLALTQDGYDKSCLTWQANVLSPSLPRRQYLD